MPLDDGSYCQTCVQVPPFSVMPYLACIIVNLHNALPAKLLLPCTLTPVSNKLTAEKVRNYLQEGRKAGITGESPLRERL